MKTSEELAEEYCKKYWDAHPETFVDGYNAGYKAAAPQWISVDKDEVMIDGKRYKLVE